MSGTELQNVNRDSGFGFELLSLGVLVPVAIAGLDYVALQWCQSRSAQVWVVPATFVLFVVQMALLSTLVGSRLPRRRLWWLVFLWAIVLVDLQVFVIAANVQSGYSAARSLGFAFGSSQAGLAIVWGVLGATAWTVRLPTAAVAFAFSWGFCLRLGGRGDWQLIVLGQALATALVCLLLRLLRFRIEPLEESGGETGEASAAAQLQFSIRHLFYWTTGVAVLVGVGRLVGWRYVILVGVGLLTVYAPAFTLISVLALWAALGRESWLTRFLVSLLAFPLLGAALAAYEGWRANAGGLGYGIVMSHTGDRWQLLAAWVTWACLSGLLFAGLVMVFRASGHRLQRRVRVPRSRG